jgi:hypothetical protein
MLMLLADVFRCNNGASLYAVEQETLNQKT